MNPSSFESSSSIYILAEKPDPEPEPDPDSDDVSDEEIGEFSLDFDFDSAGGHHHDFELVIEEGDQDVVYNLGDLIDLVRREWDEGLDDLLRERVRGIFGKDFRQLVEELHRDPEAIPERIPPVLKEMRGEPKRGEIYKTIQEYSWTKGWIAGFFVTLTERQRELADFVVRLAERVLDSERRPRVERKVEV